MVQHAASDAAMPAKHGQRSCSGVVPRVLAFARD